MKEFDLELERVAKWITSIGAKEVLLQFPEGLKTRAIEVVSTLLEHTEARYCISADPCYGACDLPVQPQADALVHFGHSQLYSTEKQLHSTEGRLYSSSGKLNSTGEEIPTLFIEARMDLNIREVVEDALSKLISSVGLITTIQHIDALSHAKMLLEDAGFQVELGEAGKRSKYPGQILGCSFSPAMDIQESVGSYLFIGSGNFHPLGVMLATGKPVVVADPLLGEVRTLEEELELMLRKRHGAIARAQDASTFGILVGTKSGQGRMDLARRILEQLEERGLEGFLLSVRELTPSLLLPFRVDAFVSTLCPRIALDDASSYSLPILTPQELEIVLGLRHWDDYTFDIMD